MARSKPKKRENEPVPVIPMVPSKPGVYMPCEICNRPTIDKPLTNSAALRAAPLKCKECIKDEVEAKEKADAAEKEATERAIEAAEAEEKNRQSGNRD